MYLYNASISPAKTVMYCEHQHSENRNVV